MKPRDLGAAIRKRGWLIIVITILAALIASVAARVQTPTYKVEIDVAAVAPEDPATHAPNATVAAIYAGAQMGSISNATESINIANGVHDRLLANGIDIPAEDLLAKVKSETDPTATFTRITVTDSSPTRVAEIANTWGEVLEAKSGDDITQQDVNLKNVLLNGTLVVTNQAVPPKKPTQPKPMVYLGLGIFLGLVLGFSTAIGIEYFDPHFRSIEEVEESVGLPVLGSTPKLKGSEAISLLSTGDAISGVNEAYSQLRSSIMFSVSGRPSKSILVAAAIPTEEAPYLAANLARSIALTERKTLLVDCDLRQQGVSRIMGAAGKSGLADSLAARKSIQPAVIETDLSYLSLLPAGPLADNSSDLLSLPLLDEYLRELEKEYEEIIIYAPALTSAIDGAVVASKVDLSLVVIDSERCSRNIVQSAMESFNMLHLKPTGAVLSNVKMGRRERSLRARAVAEVKRERVKTEAATLRKDRGRPSRQPAARMGVQPPLTAPTQAAGEIAPDKTVAAKPVKAAKQAKAPKPPKAPKAKRAPIIERKPKAEKPPKAAKVAKAPKAERPPLITRKAKPEKQPAATLEKMAPAGKIEQQRQVARPEPVEPTPYVSAASPSTPPRTEGAAPSSATHPEMARPAAETFMHAPKPDAEKPAVEATKPPREKAFAAERIAAQPGKSSSRITPVQATEGKTEEELAQLKEVLAEDFRRMGSSGASIPKDWLRAINDDKSPAKDLARIAISAYYMAFLRRYDISEENVKRITQSIIRMMRKEGEFSEMNEREAQAHLQKMLVDAGARFSSGAASNRPASARAEATSTPIVKQAKVEKERKRKERRFLRQEAAAQKKEEVPKASTNPQAVETKLWQDKGGEEDWEWD
jgi:tyrosine-protein kinase